MFIIYNTKIRIKHDTAKYFVLKNVKWIDLFIIIYHNQDKFVRDEAGIQVLISLRLNTGEGLQI